MAHAALTLREWDNEAAQAFEAVRRVEPYSAGHASLDSILSGCHLVDVAGRGLLAVRRIVHPTAVELHLAAAVSLDPARPVYQWAVRQAKLWAFEQGADVVSMATPYPALARAAQRAGWTPAGTILRATVEH